MTVCGREPADYESVIWARTTLLATHQPRDHDRVTAYRILSQVSPRWYGVRLARALMTYSYRDAGRAAPEARLALLEEAYAAASGADESEPERLEIMVDALDSCQRVLHETGRRAEGLAVREQMAGLTRTAVAAGQRGRVLEGLRAWAQGLAEEGRHDEAAALLREVLDLHDSIWDRLFLIFELDAGGRPGVAATMLGAVLDQDRSRLLDHQVSVGGVLQTLIWYAVLLDGDGRRDDAQRARSEALDLARRLAADGEPRVWSGAQYAEDAILLGSQARGVEPAAAPGQPVPAFGSDIDDWSRDLRARYFEGGTDDGTRRAAIRSGLYHLWRYRRQFLGPAKRAFDASVATARAGGSPAGLASALTDRAMAHVAAHHYAEALTDYEEALRQLN